MSDLVSEKLETTVKLPAIDAACAGDVILILGKGHEQFMTSLVGNTPYPGDKFIAQEYAKQLYNQELEEEL